MLNRRNSLRRSILQCRSNNSVSVLLDACRSVARLRVEIPYDPISNSVKHIKVNLLIDRYLRYFDQMPRVGTELALYYAMKSNTLSNKLVLVSAGVCALMLALSHNASAARHPMPP